MMVSNGGEGGGGLENPVTAVSRGGGGGLGTPATVAGSGGGAGSGNLATVARSGVGERSVKPATVLSSSDCSVKPAAAATDSGDLGKSVTAASSGGSSRRVMLHGIEIPEGMDPAISFLLTIMMDTYQVALNGSMRRCSEYEAEITGTDKEGRQWRYPVDIKNKTCSCRQWQITGLPCIRALKFITSLRGPRGDIESYVHDFYSVAKFKATYAEDLPAMVGKEQWEPFNLGFMLCAPLMKRPHGRPRTKRIRASSEGGRLGARKRKCRRCGGFGHIQRTCKESVDPAFGEEGYEQPEHEPEPIDVASSSRKGAKKVVRKNTSKKRKSPDSTNVDASVTGPVSLDSPAKNTRSKTTKAHDNPAKNTRNKKKLFI